MWSRNFGGCRACSGSAHHFVLFFSHPASQMSQSEHDMPHRIVFSSENRRQIMLMHEMHELLCRQNMELLLKSDTFFLPQFNSMCVSGRCHTTVVGFCASATLTLSCDARYPGLASFWQYNRYHDYGVGLCGRVSLRLWHLALDLKLCRVVSYLYKGL